MGPHKTKQNSPDYVWCESKQERTDNLTRSSHFVVASAQGYKVIKSVQDAE